MENSRNEQLWETAKKRVAFKKHLATYVIINIMLWVIWALTGARYTKFEWVPWPLWVTIFWGVGLFFNWFEAYGNVGKNSVEKEYEKLKDQLDNR